MRHSRSKIAAAAPNGHQELSGVRVGHKHAFERLALLHERGPDAVRLAAELNEPAVAHDAVYHGGPHLVVPEDRPPHLLNSRLVVITTDCLS